MRKSPIRHHVRQHRRTGRPVHDYDRGHGKRLAKLSLRRTKQSETGFAVQVIYETQAPETFVVNASSFDNAIEQAMSARRSISQPTEVSVNKQ